MLLCTLKNMNQQRRKINKNFLGANVTPKALGEKSVNNSPGKILFIAGMDL